jgi:O-antigen/teichoic acid export membrane protein
VNFPFRQLAKDIAIYGSGDVLLRATAFITAPIYTRIFTVEDYGTLNFVLTVTGLMGAILILGGDSAYDRFYWEAKTHHERQLVTSSWLGFLSLWSVAAIVVCLPFVGWFSNWSFGTAQYALLFALALIATPLTLMNSLCGHVLRNQFRAQLFTILTVATTLLTIGLGIVGVVVLDLGLVGAIGGTSLAAAVILPVRLWTVRGFLRPMFSLHLVRNMLAFGVPFVPAALAGWVFASADRIVLGKLSTLDQLGLFAIATSAASILNLVNGALGQAWSPHAYMLYEERPEDARVFYGQVLTYLLVGFGVLCVGMTAFADELLKVLATPEFYAAAPAVGPLALGFMAYATIQVTASGISLMKKTRYLALYTWVAALLNVALNVVLVPKWGMMASSWTIAGTYLFLTTAYLVTGQRLWPVKYEMRRGLTAVAITILATIGAMYLPDFSFVEGIVVKSLYCLAFVALLILCQVLDEREKRALVSLLPSRLKPLLT